MASAVSISCMPGPRVALNFSAELLTMENLTAFDLLS